MDVIEVTGFGGPDMLRTARRPAPVAGPGQVVVRIHAANVNPTDLAARAGYGPIAMPEPPFVPGWDFAGDVECVGEGTTGFQPGDRVAGMIHWYDLRGATGTYAEAVAVDASVLARLPEGLDYATAATVPLNALSAAQGIDLLRLTGPTAVLVTGASGAVGSYAVQLAANAGHRVTAVVNVADHAWARALGAAQVLDRDADLGAFGSLAAVFDAVPLGESVLAAIADDGALVTTRPLPAAAGVLASARKVDVRAFLVRHDQARMQQLINAVARDELLTRVHETLPLAQAATAHRLVEAGGLRGKVVLLP
jgi:NADPH2:quinone reductase